MPDRKSSSFLKRLPGIRHILRLKAVILRISSSLNRLSAIEAVRLLDVDLLNHPRFTDPLRLLRYQSRTCSQHGEDGMIREIFRRIGTTNRVFAEVGVGDGTENNTAFLLSTGWTGYWIDGDDLFVDTVKDRPDLSDGCLKWLVSFVTRENVAGLFKQMGVPIEIDFMSLDIDQNTYYLWDGLRQYRPRVVVVEYNSVLPADVDWKVRYESSRTWNGTQNFGASLKAFEKLARELGYSLVGCDFHGLNAFFVRDDLAASKFAEPFTSENHYEPPRLFMNHRPYHRAAILDRIRAE